MSNKKENMEIVEMYRRKLFYGIDNYEFEERVAIMEFDGKIAPEIAAMLAFNDLIKYYSYKQGKLK